MLNYVVEFLGQYPQFNLLLATVGGLRLIMKPLFSALRMIVAQTLTKSDDDLLNRLEKSKTYEALLYALDWFTSIKPLTK